MWNTKNKGETSNNRGDWNHFTLRQCLSNIPVEHEIKEPQKDKIYWALHVLLKVQM